MDSDPALTLRPCSSAGYDCGMALELVKPSHVDDPLLDEVIGKLVAHWGNAGPGWGLGRAPAEVQIGRAHV